MCGLIRGGCREVTELRRGERPERSMTDLVLVPRIATLDQVTLATGHARRALADLGRLILCVPEHLAAGTTRMLRLHGLSSITRRNGPRGSVRLAWGLCAGRTCCSSRAMTRRHPRIERWAAGLHLGHRERQAGTLRGPARRLGFG
jgi:hypothetical protein